MAAAAAASRRAARCMALGGLGLTGAGLAQAVHLRLHYVGPVEPEGDRHGRAGHELRGPPLRLLFVGDSACMGVGAKIAAPLQSACAERLATLRERQVDWSTVGAVGADVRELRALVEAQQASDAASGRSGAFDIAVVLCGVNDGKKILQGRSPSTFRKDLQELCATLRQAAPNGRISVPCLPAVKSAPLLQTWPMCHLVGAFFGQFEAQKEALAASASIHCPSPPIDGMPGPTDTKLWSDDGIHPSGEGYQRVGEWLGSALARE